MFIIVKSSRLSGPYSGPTCVAIGVPAGQVYECKLAATIIAARLTKRNPVGFDVIQVNPMYRKDDTLVWVEAELK